MKFKFELEVGAFIRKSVRKQLYNSKHKLEYQYSEDSASVFIQEDKGFFESTFYVRGTFFPDTQECEYQIKHWINQIKQLQD